MSKKYILAVDQGTTGTTAALVNIQGELFASSYREISQFYPNPGWVEHDPQEILESVYFCIKEVLAASSIPKRDIISMGITNQRETTIIWERETGEAIHKAIVWQCRRTSSLCQELNNTFDGKKISEITGLSIDPYFSATKIKWILDTVPGAREKAKQGKLAFGTVDSWLIWNMTGGKKHVTDITNASRTMLLDLVTQEWSQEILDLFNIPKELLPEICDSDADFGSCEINELDNLQLTISGVAGDQHASLFGQACFSIGETKCTYGTGAFLLMNTGSKIKKSDKGLLSTVAWKVKGRVEYALEGSVFSAGGTVQWLRDELNIIDSADAVEKLARSVNDTGGVYFVPAFTGLGAPHWDMDARGTILGLTRGANKAHIARAALEAIAYQCEEVLKIMQQESGNDVLELKVDGGATSNELLMQMQADISNCRINRTAVQETTVLGAAFIAGIGSGFWDSKSEITAMWESQRVYTPLMTATQRDHKLNDWSKAVGRSKTWASHL
ncbi:glycerol kinase GlpK [Chloroflexi bacterium]|nr:glycerol kinase GlpK [Chloroflexota bacterium]